MPNHEFSFQDHLQRAGELYQAVLAFSPAYQAADAKFALTVFSEKIETARVASMKVAGRKEVFQDVVSDRTALVSKIGPWVTQALAYVKSNTAWESRLDAMKAAADKVRGIRPPKEKPKDGDPEKKTREYGDRSYVEITEAFRAFVARLEGLTGYSPADERISLGALSTRWSELNDLNLAFQKAERELMDAVADRADAFLGDEGLKFVFDGVKTNTKGQYGQGSSQYKAISGIPW